MKTAEEMVKLQKECMRNNIMKAIEKNAKQGFSGYRTTEPNCPFWLQQELVSLGYKISIVKRNENQVNISWGENVNA